MEFAQSTLRDAAAQALAGHGYDVLEPVKGAGGARLKVTKNGEIALALVRTSSDRWVGWMRDAKGALKGLDDADIVVVAAIDEGHDHIDIMAFEPDVVRDAFEANLAARQAQNPNLSATAPIFVCLDETRKEKATATSSNLKTKAIWSETVTPSAEAAALDAAQDDDWSDQVQVEGPDDGDVDDEGDDYGKMDLQAFLDDVKAELAARLNVPEKCISLELHLQL